MKKSKKLKNKQPAPPQRADSSKFPVQTETSKNQRLKKQNKTKATSESVIDVVIAALRCVESAPSIRFTLPLKLVLKMPSDESEEAYPPFCAAKDLEFIRNLCLERILKMISFYFPEDTDSAFRLFFMDMGVRENEIQDLHKLCPSEGTVDEKAKENFEEMIKLITKKAQRRRKKSVTQNRVSAAWLPLPMFYNKSKYVSSEQKSSADLRATCYATLSPLSKFPTMVIEAKSNWVQYLPEIRKNLGEIQLNIHARGNCLLSTPKNPDECRLVQSSLEKVENTHNVAWHSYSVKQTLSLKVAIKGLPANIDPKSVEKELHNLGFIPEYVRVIHKQGGRPGCVCLAILKRTVNLIPSIYNVVKLLDYSVTIETWRGKKAPMQCYKCQKFRHHSQNCHRQMACVRCSGEHLAKDCKHPREEPAKCANCGGAHPANNPACPVFLREARKRDLSGAYDPCPSKFASEESLTHTV